MKVNILGQDYTIKKQTEAENEKLEGANGLCETCAKEIIINDFEMSVNTLDNIEEFKKKVLRHEIIHAFLFESGLDNNSSYASNEELVDWIAIQIPKLVKSMNECEVL